MKAAFVPVEERLAILVQEGVSPDVAEALLGMYDGIASGRVAHEAGTEQIYGTVELIDAVERIARQVAA